MTMLELSCSYRESAELIYIRLRELREARRHEQDPEAARSLQTRINALKPLLRETRELAAFTAHYYDRRSRKNGRYTL